VYPREKRDNAVLDAQLEKLAERMATNKKTKSGIWRDLAIRKRKTEVEFQLTPIIEIGKKYGLTLPLTSHVRQTIREMESNEKEMALQNLYQLKDIYNQRKT
jgi:2-dehydropantoate 2-reductase